jgi:hypothetical protein
MGLLIVVFVLQYNKEDHLVHPQMIVTVMNIVYYPVLDLVFVLPYKEDPLVHLQMIVTVMNIVYYPVLDLVFVLPYKEESLV